MIVMKFGGTSVEDSQAIRRVIEIVKSETSRKPIVVYLLAPASPTSF